MSAIDDFLANNNEYALNHVPGRSPRPASHIAIVACMDARLDVHRILGLEPGQAHVIRNAGGTVTDDVVRSLTVSQRVLGTTEIMLVHHTDCGMAKSTDDAFKGALEADTGIRPSWAAEFFQDPGQDVRQSMARIKASPFILHKDAIRGFVFDVESGKLSEIV
jgi:carbonic anhydrase